MASNSECKTVNEPKVVPDLGVTTPKKPSGGLDLAPMVDTKKSQPVGPPASKSRLVPIMKNGVKSPKRYAANGVRMSPVRRSLYQNQRGVRRTLNAGHEGLPIEAYSGVLYDTPSKTGITRKLNLQAPEFSPRIAPHISPIRMNPSAPEFSPSASSRGMSPLAKPFSRPTVDAALSPLAAPFVPSSIPEKMPLMDLGQSLRSALNSLIKNPNPVCFHVDEQLFEIYDMKTF